MTPFEKHFAINHHITPFLSGPTLFVLCHIHCDFRSFSEIFITKMHEMIGIIDPCSYPHCFDIKKPHYRHKFEDYRGSKTNQDQALYFATRRGCRELCELARLWGATHLNGMLVEAAKRHDPKVARELCILANEWGIADGQTLKWNWLIGEAAANGHRDLCYLARYYGATKWNRMLWSAASGGHRDLCELACEWHDDADLGDELDWDEMLRHAAYSGHYDLCILAHSWGMDDDPKMSWNPMLYGAARAGRYEFCYLAREWSIADGQTLDWDSMLESAVYGRSRGCCILAREWGATNWAYMDTLARNLKASEIIKLAKSWAAEDPATLNDTERKAQRKLIEQYEHLERCARHAQWMSENF